MRTTSHPRVAVLQHEPATGPGAFSGLLRESGVHYELVGTNDPQSLSDAAAFDGAIVLGGSLAAFDPALRATRRWIGNAVAQNVPVLGVCLGGQLLAAALGGSVGPALHPEVGVHDVFRTHGGSRDPLFSRLPARFPVFGWHEDSFELPRGAVPLAGSIACEHQAFRYGTSAYGLQFHPEVRVRDLHRWASVAGNADLRKRVGADWRDLSTELARATPALDKLVKQLLDRWLDLVTEFASRRSRMRLAV